MHIKIQKNLHILIFLIVTIVYCFPIFKNFSYLGQMDWDQFVSWNAVPRESLLTYKQFPLWNPYVNGGNPCLAHPDSPFLSPFFVFVLIWGPVTGLKIQILVHMFIGLLGMYVLGRFLSFNKIGAYFSAFIYMLSSVYVLRMVEGQTEWLALAFVPWAFYYFLKGLENKSSQLGVTIFLSLMILNGVYVFIFFIIFLSIYALFKGVFLKKLMPIKHLITISLSGLLLCAVKLIPMIEFLSENPREQVELAFACFWKTPISYLPQMFLSQDQAFYDILFWRQINVNGAFFNGWHEYGAYVGILPLGLMLLGIIVKFKEHWPLLISGLLCLVISLGSASPIDVWDIIRRISFLRFLTVPSRIIFCFVFSMSIFAGFGLDFINKKVKAHPNNILFRIIKKAPLFILVFVLIDLILVNSPMFFSAFRVKPTANRRNPEFAQRYRAYNAYEPNLTYSSIYPVILSNSGVLEGYEIIKLKKGAVFIESDAEYKGELYLSNPNGKILKKHFSPNRIKAKVKSLSADLLTMNQNYHSGWKAVINGKPVQVIASRGLSSIKLPEQGIFEVEFYYLPNSFLIGLFISSVYIFWIIVVLIRKKIMLNKR